MGFSGRIIGVKGVFYIFVFIGVKYWEGFVVYLDIVCGAGG